MRWGLALVTLCGCGRIGFAPFDDADRGDVGDAPCSTWSVPVPIPELSSTGAGDAEPAVSPDGSMIVFTSDRIGGIDRLFKATRQGPGWSTPTVIGELDSGGMDSGPAWNASGDRLYFASYRAGPLGLYVTSFSGGVFGTPTIVPGLESLSESRGPTVRSDELEMFFSSRLPPGHIERATRSSPATSWQPQGNVPELVSTSDDGFPGVTSNGLELYFESSKAPGFHIARTVRPTLDAPFGAAVFVPELAGDFSDGDPQTSFDGTEMVFSSDRASAGDFNLYVATRVCP